MMIMMLLVALWVETNYTPDVHTHTAMEENMEKIYFKLSLISTYIS